MPRFYFDLHDGEHFTPDPQGVDLPSAEVARREATRTVSEIAAQEIPADGPRRLFRIVVLDASRMIISEVRIDFYATQSLPGGSSSHGSGEKDGERD